MRTFCALITIVCFFISMPVFSEDNPNKPDTNKTTQENSFLMFKGRVFGPDGKPVTGAKVRPCREAQVQAVTTDSDGKYEVPFPFPDGFQKTFLLEASYAGKPTLYSMLAKTVTGDTDLKGDIVLAPAGTIRGKVSDKEGKPIPSVNVIASIGDATIRSTECDTTGQFVIPEVAGNVEYTLTIKAEHFGRIRCDAVQVAPGTTQDVGTRVLYRADKTIEGTVKDETGKPVADASIGCVNETRESLSTRSDANGCFRFKNLVEGYYRIGAIFNGQKCREQVSTMAGPVAHIELILKSSPQNTAIEEKLPAPASIAPADAVKLHFPTDHSAGTIGLKDPDAYWPMWGFQGPDARGEVAIPKGKRWALQLGPSVKVNPALLDQLPPDELEVLAVENWNPQEVNEVVKHLPRFKQLHGLNLKGVDLDQVDINPLSDMSRLTDLSVNFETVTDPGFKPIRCLKQVQRLYLSGKSLNRTALESIAALDALRTLDLSANSIDNSDLAALVPLKNLEALKLSRIGTMTAEGYANLARITSLKEVSLGNLDVMPGQLAELAKLPHLEQLSMTRVLNEHLIAMKPLQSLKTLKLHTSLNDTRHYFSEAGFSAVAELKNLEVLHIEACGPTSNDSLKSLASLPNLKVLSIVNREDVTDTQMAYFAQMKAIEDLGIRGSQITDAGLDKLTELKSLKKLRLFPDSKVTPGGIARLKQAIPGLEVVN